MLPAQHRDLMTIACTHCSRMNSADARYCYHDGASLLGSDSPALAARKTFLAPFVFVSGLSCKDFDEFAVGCQRHWDAAVEMLQRGYFQQFFFGLGRMDLAQIAQEAANFPDRDRGLDQFLGRLPSTSLPAAKLDVQPKLVNLGTLKVGAHSQLELNLENQGSRLIFGSISSNCDWLTATDTGDARLFQFRDSATITIQVKGQHLRAGAKQIEGNLFIESNAGTFKLKIVANVPIEGFPEGCLAGARSPRELADRAKKFPKEAGALFESGAVARWYHANGWDYPVQGPASNGMAAVQQFFEALGLSKAPKVFVAEQQLHLHGAPGAKLSRQIHVRSEEHRPVYAHALSTVGWCVVKPGLTQGNLVTLPVEIVVPQQAGQTLHTVIRVTSNGQQRFDIPVQVTVQAASTAVIAAAVSAPLIARPALSGGAVKASKIDTPGSVQTAAKATPRSNADFALPSATPTAAGAPFDAPTLFKHLAPLIILGFVLFGLVGKDVFSDAPKPQQVAVNDGPIEEGRGPGLHEANFKADIKDEPDEGEQVTGHKIDDEPEERFGLAVAPVKVEVKDEPPEMAPSGAGKKVPIDPSLRVAYAYDSSKHWGLIDTSNGKRLTFGRNGHTNLTVVRVGGRSQYIPNGGEFRKLPDDPTREARERSSYSFVPRAGLRITQILEIVPSKQPVDVGGQQRRLMDTLLVRYLYENIGQKPIDAGLRLEIDTLIGSNDGVPFTVPGKGLVNTSADFLRPELVPDFIQALERGNLRNPGTIVHVSLKVGGAIEAPSRVTLCHWASNGDLSNIRPTSMGSDSAVIMVWPDQNLPPGRTREMGYAYGLGSVTVADPGGTLAVTLGGNYDIGQSFTITAYVNKPVAGQTLELDLPDGLERIKGEQTQRVAAPTIGDTSIISWEAKVLKTGIFPLKVRSSTGVTQTKTITIARGDAPTGGKLSLHLDGSFEPGQVFTVVGKVNEPVANQTLKLHLPPGLQKTAGADTQSFPPPPLGSKDAEVKWQVRVLKPGKYPVRVSSSTGIAQTKTITIVQPTRGEGAFQLLLTGDFVPGKAFTVSTRVVNPSPDQKLTLVLPAGLQRAQGEETQVALADAPLAWKVKVAQPGRFTVGVKSTTGVTQRKTVSIEPPSDQAGRFTFDFAGDIRPGQEFKINAQVSNPLTGQALTLVLPKGLKLVQGTEVQTVPLGAPATLTWSVRVIEGGRLPVRIESSTGLARTKTITLSDTNSTLFGR